MQLCDRDRGRFPDVGVFVLQTLSERFTKILGDLVHADAAHRANGQSTDQGVGIFTILGEVVKMLMGYIRKITRWNISNPELAGLQRFQIWNFSQIISVQIT